jgi:hypothetical protein
MSVEAVLRAALREARPYVFNRVTPENDEWRSQTATRVLERIDAALATEPDPEVEWDPVKMRHALAAELGTVHGAIHHSHLDAALHATGLLLLPDANAAGTDAYLLHEHDGG